MAVVGLLGVAAGPRHAQAQVFTKLVAPPLAPFRAWAKAHAFSLAPTATLAPLGAIVGNARVVALTEPVHGGHEPLSLRNRMIRYLVTERGFTAVALESGLAQSRVLYDHVLGTTTEPDSILRECFSNTFGRFGENLALVHWLRDYNASRPAHRRVRLYGVDIAPQGDGPATLTSVFAYLDRVDPRLGAATRADFRGTLPASASQGSALSPIERDRISGKIHDLVATIRRRRVQFTAASPRDSYEWALRLAVNTEQDDASKALIRRRPHATSDSLDVSWAHAREVTMADNLAWALEREGPRGRIIFFAHNSHQQRHQLLTAGDDPRAPAPEGTQPVGLFLQSMFGPELVTIGSYYGSFDGAEGTQRDTTGNDRMLGSLALPAYLIDLRTLPTTGPLRPWFSRWLPARDGGSEDIMRVPVVNPLRAYDAIVYLDRITRSRPAPQRSMGSLVAPPP